MNAQTCPLKLKLPKLIKNIHRSNQSQTTNAKMLKLKSGILDILVLVAMPILHGAATRLPFIYFVIHLQNHFKFSWLEISLFLAMYQASRAITSALAIPYPKFSHFAGNAIGLAGYLTVFLFSEDLVLPFVIGTVVVGFSETMSSTQKYAKEMFKNEQYKLKYQYAFSMVGVMGAYFTGGFVYQSYKIKGVALFGAIIQSTALFLYFTYLALSRNQDEEEKAIMFSNRSISTPAVEDEGLRVEFPVKRVDFDLEEGSTNDSEQPITTEVNSVGQEKRRFGGPRRFLSTVFGSSDSINNDYNMSDKIPASWINWILCVSFGIEALSYNLSIGPIFIVTEFQKDTGIVGLIFSVGAATGVILAITVTCTSFGIKMMSKIAKSPFDLCFSMAGLGLGFFLANIPNFVGHVIGLILSLCFADLTAVIITELQASVSPVTIYSKMGPMGQVFRRSFNVVTALTGPVLFGISPRLPYFVAGSVTCAWSIVLFVAFRIFIDSTVEDIGTKTDRPNISVREKMKSFRGLVAISDLLKHDSVRMKKYGKL